MSMMSDSHPLHEVVSSLGATPQDLRAIVSEFPDLIAVRQVDGVQHVSGEGQRYLRAAHRWRSRGLSWEDIRARFADIRRSGIEPFPRQIEWTGDEQAAAADALPGKLAEREPPRQPAPGLSSDDARALVTDLRRELERVEQARREDVDRLALALSRLEQEMQLLRNEIAGTLYRRDRKKRWLGR